MDTCKEPMIMVIVGISVILSSQCAISAASFSKSYEAYTIEPYQEEYKLYPIRKIEKKEYKQTGKMIDELFEAFGPFGQGYSRTIHIDAIVPRNETASYKYNILSTTITKAQNFHLLSFHDTITIIRAENGLQDETASREKIGQLIMNEKNDPQLWITGDDQSKTHTLTFNSPPCSSLIISHFLINTNLNEDPSARFSYFNTGTSRVEEIYISFEGYEPKLNLKHFEITNRQLDVADHAWVNEEGKIMLGTELSGNLLKTKIPIHEIPDTIMDLIQGS